MDDSENHTDPVTVSAGVLRTSITVPTLAEMDDDEIAIFIDKLRERRLEPARIYEEVQRTRQAQRDAKNAEALDRCLLQLEKKLAKIDDEIKKAGDLAVKLRRLRIEVLD